MEFSAVLPRTKKPSIWLHEFVVLKFPKFPLFLKAFLGPISLLCTPKGADMKPPPYAWVYIHCAPFIHLSI